ncbi:hypothetical protein GGX14DRAFT_621236 [Mycena pura]|uniref:Uncharacterized protein n=1 Tax=Mycena pura TaxID=153505 RepID=A0AAD6YIB6_9AGAR|nr:hypothetical protein GGX14DRAFT_621236 [Mycena pura]
MDDSLSSYCAVCDRQIIPKRTLVSLAAPVANPPPPPELDAPRRTKQGLARNRSGLVHGTGRVRPNGTIKRHDSAPPVPVRTRVVIDQSPAPLYCSAACRQKDLEDFAGRPNYSDSASSDTSDDADSLVSVSNTSQDGTYRRSTPNSRSIAVLQRECGLLPLPAPTTETYNELAPRVTPAPARPLEYTSGVMMANRRMEAILPKPLKPGERAGPLTPVPGWTDGSQAWRASTYSFAPPPRSRADASDPNCAAYGSFVASPHRAGSGVVATTALSAPASPTAASCSSSSSSRNSDLLSSFEDSFARRSSSRISLFSPGTSPGSSVVGSPPRKTRTLSSAGGMLLVPDVIMRPRSGTSGSSASLDSLPQRTRSSTARRYSAGALPAQSYPGARCRMRSPLSIGSRSDDDEQECDTESEDPEEEAYVRSSAAEDHPPRRPNIETRSWSYDNVRTYPVMSLPPLKEVRVVDGAEVEVEVPRPMKRLFTFAPVEAVKPGYS